MSKKVVIGFSGGLDTSYCVKYFTDEMKYDVHSIIVNTGGFTQDELEGIAKHARTLGVTTHTTVDATKSYYDTIIKYLIYGNILKNNFSIHPLFLFLSRQSI